MKIVKIYSTPACVYCNMAKEFFKTHNVAYRDFNVAEDDQAREEMIDKSHQLGVPVIDIDGQIFIGFNRSELEQALGLKK